MEQNKDFVISMTPYDTAKDLNYCTTCTDPSINVEYVEENLKNPENLNSEYTMVLS